MTPEEVKKVCALVLRSGRPVKLEINYSGRGNDLKVAIRHIELLEPPDFDKL